MRYIVLLGRFLFSMLFILSALSHFSPDTAAYATAQGIPMASILVPLSGIIALLGGLLILVGYKARFGAWLLVIFLVPVTYLMHQFWTTQTPEMYLVQMGNFMKNLSLLGAALLITHFGSGPLSIDGRRT